MNADVWLPVKVASVVFLFCFAPGLLLIPALLPRRNSLEQLVLSIGSSFVLSTLALLVVAFIPGLLTAPKILAAQVLLLLALLLVRRWLLRRRAAELTSVFRPSVPRSVWLSLLAVLFLACTLRLPLFGYSELQDDEIDVANTAMRVIQGDQTALLVDRRGPAQPRITAAFSVLAGRPDEWILRAPAVLANVTAVVSVFVLAWYMFGVPVGLLSGLLISIEGFTLAYGRVVQMQSTLLLMMVLSVLCLYLFLKTESETEGVRYQVLGALFLAFGLLAHYEMLMMLPVLAFLYYARYGRRSWRANRRGLLISALIVAVVAGVFYLAFALNPAFRATFDYYRQNIDSRLPRDNLQQFMLVGTFYNSTLFFGVLWFLLAVAWTCEIKATISIPKPHRDFVNRTFRGSQPRAWVSASLVGFGSLAILTASMLGMVRSPWVPLVVTSAIAWICVTNRRSTIEKRALFLWFFAFFITYSFLLRELHIHYYVYSMPWMILAATSIERIYRFVARNVLAGGKRMACLGPSWVTAYRVSAGALRGGSILLLVLFLALSAYYAWLVFIQRMPEYALGYPEARNPLYPTLYDRRYGEAFGFPHKSGWKAIAYLYRTGLLRGGFETNELYLTADWYTRRLNRVDGLPRYYLYALRPHRLQSAPWPRPLDLTEYQLIGRVTVQGEERLQIYERGATAREVKTYRLEDLEGLYDRTRSVDSLYLAERFQADDRFYQELAGYLENVGQAGDAILFDVPEQSEILGYYYTGELPYYLASPSGEPSGDGAEMATLVDGIAGRQKRLFVAFWGERWRDPTGRFETWLNEHLFRLNEKWFGNVRLAQYAVPKTLPSFEMRNAQPMRVGEQIRFLGYNVSSEDDTLFLSLFWQPSGPVKGQYKVFVHLLGPGNNIVGQNDSMPVGGLRPTDSWGKDNRDEVIIDNYAIAVPSDTARAPVRIALGMYDPETGARLPVYDPSGRRQPDDTILVEATSVRP
jgi:4-amino-4-deoxy-L-arabinose transferase-like glycosyltransferase